MAESGWFSSCPARGHFAERGEARDWTSSSAALQPFFRLLPLGQVADETGEEPLTAGFLSPTALEREGLAVPALAHHHAALPMMLFLVR